MPKRAYYTCAIKAAFMAKYHGMRFHHKGDTLTEAYNDLSDFFWADFGYDIDEQDPPFYIHPDSMHLLNKKAGDWVSFFSGKVSQGSWPDMIESVIPSGDERYPYTGDGRTVYTLESMNPDWFYADRIKIIQRNGEAFFWPEFEE